MLNGFKKKKIKEKPVLRFLKKNAFAICYCQLISEN